MRIRLHNLRMAFDGREVLHGIDFDHEVSALAVIGPSGGGKSTLLRILGGLQAPTAGTMAVDGEPVTFDEAGLLRYRRGIGFVFQDGGLFHHLTARENVALPLRAVHGLGESEARERADELLERLGVAAEAEKHPVQLSGGQRQRVAIARALAPSPRLLLLDEPTSALDPEYTTELLDVICSLKQQGTRFVIVTHEMGFARHACDDVAFLYDGRLAEYGPSAQVFENPESSELRRFLARLLEWSL